MTAVYQLLSGGITLLCMSVPVFAQTGSCDLNGKTFNSVLQACVYVFDRPGADCKAGTHKVTIVGRHVLEYWGTDTGVEYSLGETRDLVSGAPEIQKNLLIGENAIPNSYMKVVGSASYNGAQLALSWTATYYTRVQVTNYRQGRIYRPGEAVATELHNVAIAIGPACSSCRVVDYSVKAGTFGSLDAAQVVLKGGTCKVN